MRALLIIAIAGLSSLPVTAGVETDEEGFVCLFDGKDLSHWTMGPDKSWAVDDGIITLKREMDGREHNSDYLWTKEQYGDFILELEFKIPERANSGIFLRTSDLSDPVYTGIEVQVSNSYGRDNLSRGGTAGAIYDCLAPTKNAVKPPGEWNQYRITCQGSRIVVMLNGEQVIDMDLDRWTEPKENPDGTPNKFPRAMKDFARVGYVGLQDHGREVWYRNVRIKRLDAPAANERKSAMYSLTPDEHGKVLETPDGRVVFRYMTRKPEKTNLKANSVCCFHPLNAPSGERLTDLAPGDHHHHRGVFLAWHTTEFREKADFSAFGPTGPTHGWNITRGDFWGWGQYAPTDGVVIENRRVELAEATAESATVSIENVWTIHDRAMMEENTSAAVRECDGAYVVDLDYRLTPAVDLVLNHTAFGGFCVRARNDGDSHYANPDGKVTLPDPHYSVPELNWPAADWYDYTIKLDTGKTVGCAVVEHPENPPATWHNPRYVWMINPCIVDKGPVTVKQGTTLRLRYRLVVHDGATPNELLKELAAAYRKP